MVATGDELMRGDQGFARSHISTFSGRVTAGKLLIQTISPTGRAYQNIITSHHPWYSSQVLFSLEGGECDIGCVTTGILLVHMIIYGDPHRSCSAWKAMNVTLVM
jgi:hypothetical protein